MEDKRTRAKMLYNHLKNIGLVSTQDDLAKKIKYNRVSVSKALNGYEDYLTRDFARAINTTFGNVVDVEWLITGEGEMLKSEDRHNTFPQSSPLSHADIDKLLDLLTKKEISLAKAQEHIDRLIDLIEKMQK